MDVFPLARCFIGPLPTQGTRAYRLQPSGAFNSGIDAAPARRAVKPDARASFDGCGRSLRREVFVLLRVLLAAGPEMAGGLERCRLGIAAGGVDSRAGEGISLVLPVATHSDVPVGKSNFAAYVRYRAIEWPAWALGAGGLRIDS